MTYYEKIKQSQNFEHFNETFIDGINDLKTELNDIVINHETIDTTALLKNTEKNSCRIYEYSPDFRYAPLYA